MSQFHLFQELTNQYTAVIVSDKTNHKIPEMIEVQDIPEMIEVQDHSYEMIEVHQVEIILDLENQKMTNF